jgi:hypothetical protein
MRLPSWNAHKTLTQAITMKGNVAISPIKNRPAAETVLRKPIDSHRGGRPEGRILEVAPATPASPSIPPLFLSSLSPAVQP